MQDTHRCCISRAAFDRSSDVFQGYRLRGLSKPSEKNKLSSRDLTLAMFPLAKLDLTIRHQISSNLVGCHVISEMKPARGRRASDHAGVLGHLRFTVFHSHMLRHRKSKGSPPEPPDFVSIG